MGYLMPSSGSSFGAPADASATNMPVWLQIVAATNTTASALVYNDSTSTAGRQIARLTAAACYAGPMIGPFTSSCQIYIGNLTGGSVNVWVRRISR